MESDAKIYLIYGVPFHYTADTRSTLDWLFGTKPSIEGYNLFDFHKDGVLIIGCWCVLRRSRDIPRDVDIPTDYTKEKFLSWCVNRNIETKHIGFYIFFD